MKLTELFVKDRLALATTRTMTDDGYMIVKDVKIARSGLQDYLAGEFTNFKKLFPGKQATDTIVVWRPEDEVFDPKSMNSFAGKPVTNTHPTTFVNATNYKALAVGFAGKNLSRDGDYLVIDELTITDSSTIKDVESGRRELSNGYVSGIEVSSGTTPYGEHYDAIQRSIRGNHIAIVDSARCGPSCSISDTKPQEESTMRIIIAGVPFEVSDESLAAAIQNQNQTLSDLKTAHADTTAKLQAQFDSAAEIATDEKQALQAKLDAAISNELTPEKLDAVIDSRIEVIAQANKIVSNFDHAGKTCLVIKREVLTTKFGDSVKDKLDSEAYVNARWDALMDMATDNTLTSSTAKTIVDAQRNMDTAHQLSDSAVAGIKRTIRNKLRSKFPVGSYAQNDDKLAKAVDDEFNRQYSVK